MRGRSIGLHIRSRERLRVAELQQSEPLDLRPLLMRIVEEVLAALMHTGRLCQGYQAEQKARHDEKDHYLEEPSVRLVVRFFHNTPADTTISVSIESAGSRRSGRPKLRTGSSLIAMLSRFVRIVAHRIHRLLELHSAGSRCATSIHRML